MPRLTLLLITLLLPTQLGCIWDRDTLASEIAGRQDAIKVIAGWFDRYPPQYYLMRLERVTAELEKDPTNLALYDDAAVASDRLGNPDAAIAWMKKKQAHLHLEPKDAPQPNHHYRTLANLGTFHAHRWVKARLAAPAEVPPLDDLRAAEQLIAQAITENPDAHFGREKYQLMMIQWLLTEDVEMESSTNPLVKLILTPVDNDKDTGYLADEGIPDAVDGLSGMIELGSGWRSADLFNLLALCLHAEGRSQPALMAWIRSTDLRESGIPSIHPSKNLIPPRPDIAEVEDPEIFKTFYTQITEAADQRHQSRTAYLLARLDRGEHPDTHPDFWNDWKEPAFPTPPSTTAIFIKANLRTLMVGIFVFTGLMLTLRRFLRARRTATP